MGTVGACTDRRNLIELAPKLPYNLAPREWTNEMHASDTEIPLEKVNSAAAGGMQGGRAKGSYVCAHVVSVPGLGRIGCGNRMDIADKEAIEISYWETSPTERPGSNSLDNLLAKSAEARVFCEKLSKFKHLFARGQHTRARRRTRLGLLHCQAVHPSAHVTLTDISPAAIDSADVWQQAFGARIDNAFACRSYDTPFEPSSYDLIFAYSAAHHFVRHRRTLHEVKRLLKNDGVAVYLHEPGCLGYLHRAAHYRVNRKRPEIPEDVLRYREIERLAREIGLNATIYFDPTRTNREPFETIYYTLLHAIPPLQHLLPCTVDIVMRVNEFQGGPSSPDVRPCSHHDAAHA